MLSFYLKLGRREGSRAGGNSGFARKCTLYWENNIDHGSSIGMGIYRSALFFTVRVKKPGEAKKKVGRTSISRFSDEDDHKLTSGWAR